MINQCVDQLHKLAALIKQVKSDRSKVLLQREFYGAIRSVEIIQNIRDNDRSI